MTLKNSTISASVRVYHSDWVWLMQNRGTGSVPQKIHELIQEKIENDGE